MNDDFVEQQYNGRPFMTPAEIESIDSFIRNRSITHEKLICFEWGSGGSTVYYVNLLFKIGFNFEWHVAEHNPDWAKKVQQNISNENVHFHVFDYKAYTRHETRTVCMAEYINCPSSLGIKFDLMLVDGRSRRRCILEARNVLKKDGVIFLHDAKRQHYQSAIAEFSYGSIVADDLWRGSFEQL